ncbi:acetate--CoA ligase family protein [Aquibaculum arenosum]|uniref:Acetate--CoA ligase family protein n=1 Tax=Aquibaculum arenosum TaxID=3032591 RepID=A0ABT5YP02_9PROT|nr:acetate--CoA ligase family protein [Fodinicurvata sp. CAU 1616]MDF2096614.1 acetate--CoA ligase family protein [Fodinicurvata sp. CAU 1616]
MSLEALLAPRSVAIIGASDNADKIGGRPIRYLQEFGFTGRILPVNPGRETVQGLPAYPSIADLPEVPDAAIIAVAGQTAVEAIEACAAKGVKAAVIMASGFGETGPEGKAEEARLRKLANAAGMRLVGPNSQGLANFGTGAILSFSTMFIEAQPQDGPVACISQSGAMSVVPYGLLRERGIGVRHVHATGNDCDVTVSELAAAVIQDPDVKLLLLYLETLTDPEHLARAAAIGRERGVPIIALKSGRSQDGQRAAASHTGAIATADRVVDAFLEKHGIWRADGVLDLVQAAELYLQGWKPAGRNLAVISNSGATCVLAADAADRAGLPLAQLAEQTEADLRSILPSFASARNPIDITAALLTDSGLFSRVLPVVGADPAVDMFLIGIPVSGRGYDYPRFASDTADFLKQSGKPVVLAAPQPKVRAAFTELGVPAFETEDEAVAALAQFAAHHELLAASRGGALSRPALATAEKAVEETAFLDEHRSLSMLEAEGLTGVERRLCQTADEAVAFLNAADSPLVLKACSAALPHKSEYGLVRLRLSDAAAVETAFSEIKAGVEDLGHAFEGVLAARMTSGERELVVGGRIDPVFGPVVMLGDGGILVEAMPDTALLLPPFDEADVRRALAGLRIAPLFEGVRGKPPLDAAAVARAAQAVGAVLAAGEGRVRSIDVNPLLVSAEGAVALDALVEVAQGE